MAEFPACENSTRLLAGVVRNLANDAELNEDGTTFARQRTCVPMADCTAIEGDGGPRGGYTATLVIAGICLIVMMLLAINWVCELLRDPDVLHQGQGLPAQTVC